MTVETASYISQLDPTFPASGDQKSEGDNHLRLVKSVLKTQFPNFGTAAMNATTTELNYMVGVTSLVQNQLNTLTSAKAAKSGDTYTGAHDFTGATPTVPTQATGDATTKAASTAFVSATAFNAALPGQTGSAGKFVTTDGTNASWGSVAGVISEISTNTAAQNGYCYAITAALTLTLPSSPGVGDWVAVQDSSASDAVVIGRNGEKIMGLAEDLTIDLSNVGMRLVYVGATLGWIIV